MYRFPHLSGLTPLLIGLCPMIYIFIFSQSVRFTFSGDRYVLYAVSTNMVVDHYHIFEIELDRWEIFAELNGAFGKCAAIRKFGQ